MIDVILLIIAVSVSIAIYATTVPLNKNQEYVCTKWTGSADPTQHNPSVCVLWEVKEKPGHRRK